MEHRTGSRRLLDAVAVGVGLLLLTSCASGRLPDTQGVDRSAYLARFSGEWTLDDEVSEDPTRVVEPPGRGADQAADTAGSDVGRPGVGRTGRGRMPGRRRGRRGARGSSGPSPAAVRAAIEAFHSVPSRFSLQVSDSAVVTTWIGEREARMEVAGDDASVTVNGQEGHASVEWDGGRLRIEHWLQGGGPLVIVDVIRALPDRDRLLVTRRIEGLSGRAPEVRLAYDLIEGS